MTRIKMERGRRNRRGRCHSCTTPLLPQCSRPWSFLSSFYSFLILSSLIGVIYLMLDYHCNTCNSPKCDLNNINKSIEEIAKNLVVMKNNYQDLEQQISRFSRELPKVEGQIEILESLASALESSSAGWDPSKDLLSNVDVFLNKSNSDLGKNRPKCKCPKGLEKFVPVN